MNQHRAAVTPLLPSRTELFLVACVLGLTALSVVSAGFAYAGWLPTWTTWAVFAAVVAAVGVLTAMRAVEHLRARPEDRTEPAGSHR